MIRPLPLAQSRCSSRRSQRRATSRSPLPKNLSLSSSALCSSSQVIAACAQLCPAGRPRSPLRYIRATNYKLTVRGAHPAKLNYFASFAFSAAKSPPPPSSPALQTVSQYRKHRRVSLSVISTAGRNLRSLTFVRDDTPLPMWCDTVSCGEDEGGGVNLVLLWSKVFAAAQIFQWPSRLSRSRREFTAETRSTPRKEFYHVK